MSQRFDPKTHFKVEDPLEIKPVELNAPTVRPKKKLDPKKEKELLKKEIERIVPKADVNPEGNPRLRTPTVMQALMLPLQKIPRKEGEPPKDWNQPHLQELKWQIQLVSAFMCTVPFITFYVICTNGYLIETYGQHMANNLGAAGAVIAVQIILFVTVVVKHSEDFMRVWEGKGHIPYDESLID